MFWKKKSSRSNYLTFYIDQGDLKVEFSFEDIEDIIVLTDSAVNGKVRHQCIETIYKKIYDGGLYTEAELFIEGVNKVIKPSEYQP